MVTNYLKIVNQYYKDNNRALVLKLPTKDKDNDEETTEVTRITTDLR